MRTKADVFSMAPARAAVTTTTNVPIHWHACRERASVPARVCCAVPMRTANQKVMPLGADVALDSRKIKMENVFRVSLQFPSTQLEGWRVYIHFIFQNATITIAARMRFVL